MFKKKRDQLKPIDSPVYGYWQALYLCFYSSRLYVDVGKRWRGIGLMYLLLVIALCSIPASIQQTMKFRHMLDLELFHPLSQVPQIMVQNGQVVFDQPMPYVIKNVHKRPVIVIDTTDSVNSVDALYPDLNLLITKDRMIFKVPGPEFMGQGGSMVQRNNLQAQVFGKNSNFVFDGKSIVQEGWISNLVTFTQMLIYPTIVGMCFAIFAIVFTVLAFLGQLFATIFFSFKPRFAQSCRLFMVAATPMTFLFLCLLATGVTFPGFGYLLLILLIGYFCFALFSLRRESKRMVAA